MRNTAEGRLDRQAGRPQHDSLPVEAIHQDDLDAIVEAADWNDTLLITLVGPPETDKPGLLRHAAHLVEDKGHRAVLINLGDCVSPVDVGDAICHQFGPRLSWILFPSFMRVQRALAMYWPPTRREANGIDELLGQAPKGWIRWGAARWARQRLSRLPNTSSQLTSDHHDRVDRLQNLAPQALARDLRALAGRRRYRHLYMLFDGHERYYETIASRRSPRDFVWALAEELHAAHVKITLVVARETPLVPTNLSEVWPGTEELPRTSMLRQRLLAKPPASNREDNPTGDASTLLAAAAMPRSFDLELLSVLAGSEVRPNTLDELVANGSVMPTADSTAAHPRWRVAPALRAHLFAELASRDHDAFSEAHARLLHHYKTAPVREDPEEEFAQRLERLYHLTAIAPQRGLDELFTLADTALAEYRVDRCQRIVDALEELYSLDEAEQIRILLLRVKLYADLQGFDAAEGLLQKAAAKRPSITERFDSGTAAIEFELAKLDRLRGNYPAALDRYEQLERLAHEMPTDRLAVTHANWQLGVVLTRINDIPSAFRHLELARTGYELLLQDGEHAAQADARRLGVRNLMLKQAHIDRQLADLHRLVGDLGGAYRHINAARSAYQGRDERSLAYADVTHAHILRMDGQLSAAAREAAAVRERYESGELPDKRLRAYALRAELLACIGDVDRASAERLRDIPPDIYPAASPGGWLVLGEISRREAHWADAGDYYWWALDATVRSHGRADRCIALIGLLECARLAPASVRASLPGPMTLLDSLLDEPCAREIPWIAVTTQLLRAYWRRDEQDDALSLAHGAALRIRTSDGARSNLGLVADAQRTLAADQLPPIRQVLP